MKPKPRSAFHIFKVPVAILFSLHLQPSGRRISSSAEESPKLNPVAQFATVLNHVHDFSAGGALLKLHHLRTYNAANETNHRALIVIRFDGAHSPFAFLTGFSPVSFDRMCSIASTMPRMASGRVTGGFALTGAA
jgi:hypothetical protein